MTFESQPIINMYVVNAACTRNGLSIACATGII